MISPDFLRPCRHTITILLACGVPAFAWAQTAPPPAPAQLPAAAGETITLSPFEVRSERDTGWVASSSLVGTRTNEQLVNLPMSIDAITADFMQDLGAFTLEDAAAFVANMNTTSLLEAKADESRSSYRGMDIGGRAYGQSARNFFLWYAPTDNYNVERIDFNKGSNSLMFGDSSPGGQAATYTKRARPQNFAKLFAMFGSYNSHRLMLDVNRRLGEKAALRINVVDRADRSYVDFSDAALRAADAAFSYRMFPNTTVRIEAEAGKFQRERASNSVSIRTDSAPGLGFSTTNRWYYTTDGVIQQRTSSLPAAIDRANIGGNTVTLLDGQPVVVRLMTQTGSTTVFSGRTITVPGFPKSLNIYGIHDFLNRPYTNVSTWIEQRLGKLDLEFAYNQQNQYQDRNDSAFSGTLSIDGRGRPFQDSDIGYRRFGNRVKIGRLTAAYPLELGKWMKQYIVVSGNWQKDFNYNFRNNLVNLAVLDAGPTNINNHRITVRAYLDDPAAPSSAFYDRLTPENLPVTPAFRAGWVRTTDANLPFTDIRYARNFSLSSAGSYWDDRFNSLLGIRYDTFSRKRITTIPTDAIGQPIDLGTPDVAPQAYSYDPNFSLHNTSSTAGLVYHLTRTVNLYATYSESFRWQGQQLFDGTEAGAVLGQTREIGLKGSLWENRLVFTAATYRVQRKNATYVWSGSLGTNSLEDLFNPNNVLPSDPKYLNIATGLNNESSTVTSNDQSTGWETTLQLQRRGGIQARFTLAHNQISAERDFTHFKSLLNDAIARTAAALAPGDNPSLAENATFIANAKAILAANDGRATVTGNRAVPWSANWVVDYEFPRSTPLRGARLGLYGNWRDNYVIDIVNPMNFSGGIRHPVGLYAIYARKLLNRPVTFRLGIANLIDLENRTDYRKNSVAYLDANGAPVYNYKYMDPTTWDLTATVEF